MRYLYGKKELLEKPLCTHPS